MTDKTKNILTGIVVLLVLFLSYKLFVNKDKTEPVLTIDDTSTIAGGSSRFELSSSREESITLERIKRIKIDKDVFSGDVFKSLVDFRTEILPEPVGKNNPFSSQ